MRRLTVLVVVLLLAGLVVAAASPAGAAAADKTVFIVAECSWAGNPQSVEQFEFPNPDRVRIRGANNIYDEYVFEEAGWRYIGENSTMANVNATWPEFEGSFWGTFDFTDDGTIGDFEGTWAWGGMSPFGRATGTSDDGKLLKVTLGLNPEPYLPLPAAECGVAEFLVIDPHR